MQEKGTLYVVATPLGNLKDITLRALEVIRTADGIAAEDTRRTQKLLSAYDLHVPLVSFNDHNKGRRLPSLLSRLEQGQRICLVTDGGTPGVSDPGRELVEAARKSGIPVVPVPGPSALTCALSVSGLPGEAFLFLGFLPRRKSRRRKILQEAREQERTVILYEAPHRLLTLLEELREVWGERKAVLARELTKVHEEILEGPLSRLVEILKERGPRGEYTILLAPEKATKEEEPSPGLPPVRGGTGGRDGTAYGEGIDH